MPENNIELAGNTNIKTSQVDKSVDTPADFTSPEVLYNKLIETIRQYNTEGHSPMMCIYSVYHLI